jgi:hypothetical protein
MGGRLSHYLLSVLLYGRVVNMRCNCSSCLNILLIISSYHAFQVVVYSKKVVLQFSGKVQCIYQVLETGHTTYRIQVRDSLMLDQRDRDMIVLYLITLGHVN